MGETQCTCEHCGYDVPRPSGRRKHNHCPKCYWSKHVGYDLPIFDIFIEPCDGMMKPYRIDKRNQTVSSRCECGYETIGHPLKHNYRNPAELIDLVRVFMPGKMNRPDTLRRVVDRLIAQQTPRKPGP
jgi:RNHCP domain